MSSDGETLGDMLASREWRPIVAYDRAAGDIVLLRERPGQWVIGFFGERQIYLYRDGSSDFDVLPDVSPMFRQALDAMQGEPLGFAPTEFATVDEDWQCRLMED